MGKTSDGDNGSPRVMVYGTLKRGHCNNVALEDCDFLGRCAISGPYRFVDLGWYPAIVIDSSGATRRVVGEVYSITEDVLYTLDLIEGYPHYYQRSQVSTPYGNAWVYHLPEDYSRQLDSKREIANGIWEPTDEEMEEETRGSIQTVTQPKAAG